jgi:DNA-binding NtrC family response regulator
VRHETFENTVRLIGNSPAMARVRESIANAETRAGLLLIRGEPGTGKSLVADILASGERVLVHCRHTSCERVAEELSILESSSRAGRPATLVLEEIGDATEELQQLFGGLPRAFVGARIVATTSRDVESYFKKGRLGENLHSLLEAPTLWLPPLRARPGDIAELTLHFLGGLPSRRIDPEALHLLERQSWPGNVRQLKEAVRRLALLHDHVTVRRVGQELEKMRGEA